RLRDGVREHDRRPAPRARRGGVAGGGATDRAARYDQSAGGPVTTYDASTPAAATAGAPGGMVGPGSGDSPNARRSHRFRRFHSSGRRQRPNLPAGLMALVWLVIVALPLYYLISVSFRSRTDYLNNSRLAPPVDPTLE